MKSLSEFDFTNDSLFVNVNDGVSATDGMAFEQLQVPTAFQPWTMTPSVPSVPHPPNSPTPNPQAVAGWTSDPNFTRFMKIGRRVLGYGHLTAGAGAVWGMDDWHVTLPVALRAKNANISYTRLGIWAMTYHDAAGAIRVIQGQMGASNLYENMFIPLTETTPYNYPMRFNARVHAPDWRLPNPIVDASFTCLFDYETRA